MKLEHAGSVPLAAGGFGGGLVTDWVNDFERVKLFFRRDARDESDCRAVLDELRAAKHPRAELARILEAAGREYGAPQEALENARALARPDVFVVVTGQQAGLFGGPLYVLWKALTAIKLAREWSRRFAPRARFVPVFWVASDDHDLGEIDHAYFLDARAGLHRLRARWAEGERGRTAACVSFARQAAGLRDSLEALLPGAADAIIEPYRRRSVGAACAELLSRWLGSLGLVAVESVKLCALGGELFAQELREYKQTGALVHAAGQALEAAGYVPGLVEDAPAPHLFLMRQGIRVALEPMEDGNAFRERSSALAAHGLSPQTHDLPAIERRALQSPQDFSPSAALRPVWQDLALPAAAVVLGPGELAYWAQLAALHDRCRAVWPMVVPRASLTLLDAPALRAVRKLNLTPEEVVLPWGELKRRRPDLGAEASKLGQEAAGILEALERMHQQVRSVEHGLETLFAKARERIGHELNRVVEKTRSTLAQRDETGAARLEYVASFVRPKDRPQERVLCSAQVLTRDPALPARMLELLDPLSFQHHLVGWTEETPD